jgi:hypothetical protein
MSVEQPELFSGELPSLDRYERLETIQKIHGFHPSMIQEQNEIMRMDPFLNTPGGAATHLAEVILRQKKSPNVTDYTRAARSLTRGYIDYALDAQRSVTDMESLRDSLPGIRPSLLLQDVTDEEGETITPIELGVIPYMRYLDLNLLCITRSLSKIGYDPQKPKYEARNPAIVFYAKEMMGKKTVQQVAKELPAAISDQVARFVYFVERVHEIEKHTYNPLRGVAQSGLNKIYRRADVE